MPCGCHEYETLLQNPDSFPWTCLAKATIKVLAVFDPRSRCPSCMAVPKPHAVWTWGPTLFRPHPVANETRNGLSGVAFRIPRLLAGQHVSVERTFRLSAAPQQLDVTRHWRGNARHCVDSAVALAERHCLRGICDYGAPICNSQTMSTVEQADGEGATPETGRRS